jgi:translocation and assembly module TamA
VQKMRGATWYPTLLSCLVSSVFFANHAAALDKLRFVVAGANVALEQELRAASLVESAFNEKRTEPRDILSAALADYGRLLETLYANGYYGGVIHICIDGNEAASLPLLSVPGRFGEIEITVDPGPAFRFGRATISALAPDSELPPAFQTGQPARSVAIRDAVEGAVDDWRDAGHAKAKPVGQRIVADHAAHTLSSEIQMDQGPRVRFGELIITTPSAVRADRIKRIAGLPTNAVFSPETLARVTARLRRTGAFSSVSLGEAETLGAGNTMDINLALADEKPRRYGFGGEISSLEGLNLSGYWLHRNLFGGAERLRIEGEVNNIGGQTGGIDYALGGRIDIPAVFGADTNLFVLTSLEHLEEPDFVSDRIALGGGIGWLLSDQLVAEAGVTYVFSQTEDDIGAREFSLLTFPAALSMDRRDVPLDPTKGYFAKIEVTPFIGLAGSASGARAYFDGRVYRGFGAQNGTILAARLQFGSVLGAGITEVHPDFLFSSGGSGTVRGQPYKSLAVDLGGGKVIGGRSFVGMSFEARKTIKGKIGAVAFLDAGYIGAESFFDGSGQWHSGAGLGLRYKTGIGSIRFDVGVPLGGNTGSGAQIYLGIGQAF